MYKRFSWDFRFQCAFCMTDDRNMAYVVQLENKSLGLAN